MTRLSRSLVIVAAASSMAFECGPPGRDIPCTNQIAEGDVLHLELIARYAPDGEIWDGADFGGYGAIPSCAGIDRLATGVRFDARIQGRHENMLCTQFGFLPLWDAPWWRGARLPANLVPWLGGGSKEVALSRGSIVAPAGCLGLYGISLFARTGDVFAAPSLEQPHGTFVMRYFGTDAPAACGPEFTGRLDPTGATYCGDMYLVRVTR